jgi:hypothetical protein
VHDHAVVRVLEPDRGLELEADPDVRAREADRFLSDAGRATGLDRAERALELPLATIGWIDSSQRSIGIESACARKFSDSGRPT